MKRGEAIQWMRGLVRIDIGKAIQWRGSGHSLNRRTLKIEKLLSSSPSQKSALKRVSVILRVVIFFTLTETLLPDPTPTPPNTPKRTRNQPETDPKQSQTEPNGPETEPKWTEIKLFGVGRPGGLSGWGGGGGGGCKGKKKITTPECKCDPPNLPLHPGNSFRNF